MGRPHRPAGASSGVARMICPPFVRWPVPAWLRSSLARRSTIMAQRESTIRTRPWIMSHCLVAVPFKMTGSLGRMLLSQNGPGLTRGIPDRLDADYREDLPGRIPRELIAQVHPRVDGERDIVLYQRMLRFCVMRSAAVFASMAHGVEAPYDE